MKLYVWKPDGHGQLTLSVCAESEGAAKAAVDKRVAEIIRQEGDYPVYGWGTDYYELAVYEPGQVCTNRND